MSASEQESATGPPRKVPGAQPSFTGRKLIVPLAYHCPGFVQSIIWKRWEREAWRLFIEFCRTNDERLLLAFTTHIRAMRVHEGRRRL
jgi:hypothetical protein